MFPTVELTIPAHLISDAPRPILVPVGMTYSAADPLAVHMLFPAEVTLHGTRVTWTFARALLDSGLRTPSGTGDVRVWPGDRHRTMVELRSPEGVALLRFTTARLRHFLLHAYATVPAELESRAIDIDGGLATLLRESRP
ncbi:SsgA family sporulation/cell division regulator [Streptomyces sp. NPDC020965]|uniref:SsgA family sporulation/cell division regulator n=1 Tax=Streptomyces sp. NPDC020965 TaxID=3365105 RepID=UPI0037A84989